MHIINIELENFKTIEKFSADFTGGVYLVTGENEIGKSTLLNAIGTLLTGQRTDNLLRKGQEKGFAKMTVGEGDNAYTVELRVTEKNPRGVLTVEKAGTGLKSSNLTALQGIFQYQDFDAHEFVKWSETAEGRRKQVAVVMSLLPKEAQARLNAIDTELKKDKDSRTPINADIKAYLNLLDKAGVTPEDLKKYAKTLDLAKLIDQRSEAEKAAAQVGNVKERLEERELALKALPDTLQQKIDDFKAVGERLDAEAVEAKKAYDAAIARIEAQRQAAADNLFNEKADIKAREKELKEKVSQAKTWLKEQEKNQVDIATLQAQIDTVQEHNKKAQTVQQYLANQKVLKEKQAEKAKLEKNLAKLQEERQQLVDNAALPIPGLDFTDDGLTLNGIPFKAGEVSTSQEMEVAAKLIIAKNPTVKVFRIAQGESLGKDRLNAIVDFANANGYQGFIEEVHRGQQELIIEKYQEKN